MSNTKKMTITEGLVELKLYDNKIRKAITDADFIQIKKKRADKIGTLSVEEYEKRAKNAYQSITDMIKNKDAIKRAIVLSNATTKVTIDGKEMTVAEAIERRSLNDIAHNLIEEMGDQLASAEQDLANKNREVDFQAEKMLVSYYGKETAKKINKEDYDAIVNPYKEANEYVVVDPLGLRNEYEKLEKEYDGFMANVDTVLSISNATTFIEIEV